MPAGWKSRCASKGTFLRIRGLVAIGEFSRSSVYPSGAARATSSPAMFPEAPARLSTMKGRPSASPSLGE